MWKPYNVPEPCKRRSKKTNTALYPFLVLCFCMECKEYYQNFTYTLCRFYQLKSIPWSHEQWTPGKAFCFKKQPDRCLRDKGKPSLVATVKHLVAIGPSRGFKNPNNIKFMCKNTLFYFDSLSRTLWIPCFSKIEGSWRPLYQASLVVAFFQQHVLISCLCITCLGFFELYQYGSAYIS